MSNADQNTAIILVAKQMERLATQYEALAHRMDARAGVEDVRFHGLEIEQASIKREQREGFSQVNRRLDISNGRHDKNEAAIGRNNGLIAEHGALHHDADVRALARREAYTGITRWAMVIWRSDIAKFLIAGALAYFGLRTV